MIVLPQGDAVVVFTQEAHAHLAGELAARLQPGELDRSAMISAARIHDNGWREADLAPTIDGQGRPHTFYRVPPEVYTAVWRRGIARAAGVDPLVGLLVGLHGARFFRANPHHDVQTLYAEERTRQDRVLAELGLAASWRALPVAVQEASDWIALVDQLSLMVCGELADTTTATVCGARYRMVRSAGSMTVDPWPFADPGVPVSIEGRHWPGHAVPSTRARRQLPSEAPVVTRRVAVAPEDHEEKGQAGAWR